MKHFKTVFGFHFKESILSKNFIFTTVILVSLILGFFAFTHFLNSDDEKDNVVVVNNSSYPLDEKALNKDNSFTTFILNDEKVISKTKKEVKDGDIDGLLIIEDKNGAPSIQYFYKNFSDFETITHLENTLQQSYLNKTVQDKHIQPEIAKSLLTKVHVKDMPLEKQDSIGLVYFFIFIMYMFFIMFGQTVSMSISAEKTSRVMEIMITKVKPITMMYAKIFSSLVNGLIQIGILGLAYLLAKQLGWTSEQTHLFAMPLDLSVLNINTFMYFIIFFILGYILYALLFAALSSVINRIEDLANVIFPVSLVLMGAFIIGIRSMMDPNSSLVMFGNYFPFFSPIVAFSRIILGEATQLQIILSLGILIATILLTGIFASRVYKNGVMRYSHKTTLMDVLKLVKKN
ncbi:ABC transporter permease [Bacillus toyonensis]|uniref:ABC transporter permease n=1 Tax=Bacillus toyonensis TaxID=155322 RepID=UPI002E1EF291|nr:ABC transporter permease [Bacillus toyonensis]MED2737181.1 ABC transporter permease [Bacillus toyonensis]